MKSVFNRYELTPPNHRASDEDDFRQRKLLKYNGTSVIFTQIFFIFRTNASKFIIQTKKIKTYVCVDKLQLASSLDSFSKLSGTFLHL